MMASQDKVGKKAYPGGKFYMYRLQLKDKHGTPYSLSIPQMYLSDKAIERRTQQKLPIDSTDLPVNPEYIKKISQYEGVKVVCHSKWNNTLLVRSKSIPVLDMISKLPFVISHRLIWTSPDSIDVSEGRMRTHDEFNKLDSIPQEYYGGCAGQIMAIKGEQLHKRGFTGNGITIAILDGGFMNADKLEVFRNMKLAGCHDFVYPPSPNIFKELEHGTKVLSCMAVNVPYIYVGTAVNASYMLLRCEDDQSESLAEEDYWAEAAEYADSAGVNIINSSLGYFSFDNSADDYHYRDLDGETALISRTASRLASKGIILVNSAGNTGMGTWKKITVPADAKDILCVGAIGLNGINATFSSIGPTQDGRVKPDVMAVGSPAAVITGRGTLIQDMGTSFAAPIVCGLVACLWQALPQLSANQIMDLVRRSSDNYETPDNIYGYGLPDFWKAYQMGLAQQKMYRY